MYRPFFMQTPEKLMAEYWSLRRQGHKIEPYEAERPLTIDDPYWNHAFGFKDLTTGFTYYIRKNDLRDSKLRPYLSGPKERKWLFAQLPD